MCTRRRGKGKIGEKEGRKGPTLSRGFGFIRLLRWLLQHACSMYVRVPPLWTDYMNLRTTRLREWLRLILCGRLFPIEVTLADWPMVRMWCLLQMQIASGYTPRRQFPIAIGYGWDRRQLRTSQNPNGNHIHPNLESYARHVGAKLRQETRKRKDENDQ